MYSENLHFEIDIDVPPAKVFAFLSDPKNIPLVLPGLIENTDIPELPIKEGAAFRFKYQMLGVVTEGDVIIEKVEKDAAYDFISKGGIESKWVQRFTETDKGTHFTLDVLYTPPQSWLDKVKSAVATQMNKGEGEKYVQNIKTLLELQA